MLSPHNADTEFLASNSVACGAGGFYFDTDLVARLPVAPLLRPHTEFASIWAVGLHETEMVQAFIAAAPLGVAVRGPRPHADARVWPRTTGKTVSRRFPPDADSHGIFCVAQVPRSTVIRCYLDAIFEFYEARQSWHGAFAFMGTRAMKLAWDRAPSDLRRERSQIWRETFFHSSVCLGTRAQQRDKIKGSNLTIGQMCDGRLDHIPPQPGAGKCGKAKDACVFCHLVAATDKGEVPFYMRPPGIGACPCDAAAECGRS